MNGTIPSSRNHNSCRNTKVLIPFSPRCPSLGRPSQHAHVRRGLKFAAGENRVFPDSFSFSRTRSHVREPSCECSSAASVPALPISPPCFMPMYKLIRSISPASVPTDPSRPPLRMLANIYASLQFDDWNCCCHVSVSRYHWRPFTGSSSPLFTTNCLHHPRYKLHPYVVLQ
jgi:hypothetical protein